VARARAGDVRALEGLAEVGRYLGIGISNLVVIIAPDRIVIGGGIAAAGELLFEPIRAELRRRVHMTSLDDVTLVAAELGTWAGSIGAAVHGAEQASSS
jgi:predicted NBD/HSP70 family sugar kinase